MYGGVQQPLEHGLYKVLQFVILAYLCQREMHNTMIFLWKYQNPPSSGLQSLDIVTGWPRE
jgi:hypothetical protein